MKKFLAAALVLASIAAVVAIFLVPTSAGAQSPPPIDLSSDCSSVGASDNPACKGSDQFDTVVVNILNTAISFIAVVAVIIIIIAGVRMTTSSGNPSSVQAAKNMILYAVIGVVVAALSYAIVRWVVLSL